MDLFPAFLKLGGRRALLVGGGTVAAAKLDVLRLAGADVTVVAPAIHPSIRTPDVRVEARAFEESDLDGVWFVVAAATPDINRVVAQAAERRHIFVNAVDDPPNASAYLGGVLRRSGVTIAISTSGDAPALAGLLREGLDALLPADLDGWIETARRLRPEWKARNTPMPERRPQLLEALIARYELTAPAAASEGRPPSRPGASAGQPSAGDDARSGLPRRSPCEVNGAKAGAWGVQGPRASEVTNERSNK